MQLVKINISQTSAQLGMESKRAFLEHVNPSQQQLNIKMNLVRVEIDSTAPQLRIDQSRCFAESGLKKPIELSTDNASFSRQKMIESIGKIVDQGNQLLDVHNGGNPIAEQALYNAYDQFVGEFNLVTMPKSRPRIDVIEGTVDIQVKGGNVENRTIPQRTTYRFNPAQLNIYLKQRNSVRYSVDTYA